MGIATVSAAFANFKLHGINYTLRIGPDWITELSDRCKLYDQVVADLTQLQAVTSNVRIFSLNDCNAGDVLMRAVQQVNNNNNANNNNMGVWLGLWVGPNGLNFAAERAALLELLGRYSFDMVQGIHVSSEAIYRGDLTVEQAIAYRDTIKADMVANGWPDIPVVPADIVRLLGMHELLDLIVSMSVSLSLTLNWLFFSSNSF